MVYTIKCIRKIRVNYISLTLFAKCFRIINIGIEYRTSKKWNEKDGKYYTEFNS